MSNGIINILLNAIENDLLLSINYVDSKGHLSTRIIQPKGISRGVLSAICLTSGRQFRRFTIRNINNVLPLNTIGSTLSDNSQETMDPIERIKKKIELVKQVYSERRERLRSR